MGANAQTTVPTFTTGQVLTAAQVNEINTGIPVFATTTTRDAAFGGTGEKTLAQGQLCYIEATDKVQFYNGTAWANLSTVTNVEQFTTSGTFTPPTGVTYAIATIIGAGGGVGNNTAAGTGGTSSVAFASGTISCTGGGPVQYNTASISPNSVVAGTDFLGQGAQISFYANTAYTQSTRAGDGQRKRVGAAVTPGSGITITVGAGGVAGANGAKGGDGYVTIEYVV